MYKIKHKFILDFVMIFCFPYFAFTMEFYPKDIEDLTQDDLKKEAPMLKPFLRSKKVVFVSECLVNQNIRAYGIGNASGEGAVVSLLDLLFKNGIGITVVSCPEIPYEGLQRKASGKKRYSNDYYRTICKKHAQDIIDRCIMYINDGYKIGGFIGISGSPSCAVKSCWNSNHTLRNEPGVFVEELQKLLKENGIKIKFIEFGFHNIAKSLAEIQQMIDDLVH